MKTILITGATDGIGLATAKKLAKQGHKLLIHGRNAEKLERVRAELAGLGADVEGYLADLSDLKQAEKLAAEVAANHERLDVLINNAGIFKTNQPITAAGLDVRFIVNTLAPYLLTRRLLPLMDAGSRVVNLSSAAQAPVDLQALAGKQRLGDMPAYAQSKLAITMWTRQLARELGAEGPVIVAVNPGSLLATRMVKEGFGVAGNDISIGADILIRAALSDEFADASGRYFDNDARHFNDPHPEGLDDRKGAELVEAIEALLGKLVG